MSFGISIFSEEDTELMTQFAALCAREPALRMNHALELTHGDYSKAYTIANVWANTPEFNTLIQQAKNAMTAMDKLTKEEDFIVEVQRRMKGFEGKLWLESARFYAELRGYIKKDGNTTTVTNNVMYVPAPQPLNAWESGAIAHQHNLQQEAVSIDNDD